MPHGASPRVVKAPAIRTHRSVVVGFIILFCLFLCTAWIGALSLREKQKHGGLRKAIASIRKYMVSVDESYDLLNDTDLILEAERLALPLVLSSVRHQELEEALEDVQMKLSTGWIIYRGIMYYFGNRMLKQDEWVKRCAALKAEIVSIQDKDEQEFLGISVASRNGHFWIGYRYDAPHSRFVQHNPRVPASLTYWADGFPQNPEANQCVVLSSGCPVPYKCWMNYPCSRYQKGICKQSPDLRWLS